MVDSVVTFALENLSRLLVSEVTLLASVEDQIKSLRDELSFMDIFIKSSKGKREDPLVREVVNQIIDVAYQAEDVVDTYVVNVNKQRSRNMFGKCFHSKHHVMMLHEVNDQINTIKKRINEIYQNKSKYDIQQGDFESTIENKEFAKDSSLLARRRDVEEDEVVGLVHDSDEVISHLDERGDSSRRVVCIIGMGGLGKTTLARKIYNSNKVKCMFPCRVWGFVSNYYRAQKLLMSLLKLLGLSAEECKDLTDQEKMKEKVKECMSGKKYLVVLDDIWKTQVWDELQKAFPDDNNGSRILITTRVEDISHYTRASFTYRLPFLEESQSWELFCNKVFCKEKCPHELESLGMEMTKACKGLPLAIVVLAGMVAKKEKSQREWHKIKDHVSWYLAQEDYRIVTDILKLSYDDLPQILKPCFLYLGVYPEDYEISVRILCRLWIAEGFIQAKEVGTSNSPEAEDIADTYLDRLVERSLVQVASRRSDGGVKTCRVHDLLRDLCILESRENKFMEVCTELDINKHNSRRVSLQYRGKFWPIKDNQSHAHARSLLRFGERAYWNDKSQGWKRIRNSFKLARVLDMNDVLLYLSPSSELKTLIHLRYLKMTIRDSEIMNNTLDFICNFWNLETLHLMFEEYCSITLPSKIWKLKSLRHIHLKYYVKKWTWGASMSKMKIGEAKVENLQTLGDISLDVRTTSFLNKGMFPNLTKLTLCRMEGRQEEEEELLGKVLQCLNKLRTLKLIGISEILLDPNVFPSSLTKITIKHFSKLDPRIIKTLGQLPYLQILKLCEGKIHGYVNCGAGDFLKLQVLHVTDVSMVDADSWKIEEGTMPHIRHRLIRIIPDETC
ncbi:disease resistance protein RPP13-like [Arachis stenosperma]|uniref:disease resistance protein RPP13-like n=1 Tax=Arachis stenosperma TaxID=217475 RepID=UPI0025AD4487|nr:disease resistance protein RPP13-like [Arachis stenosperma]